MALKHKDIMVQCAALKQQKQKEEELLNMEKRNLKHLEDEIKSLLDQIDKLEKRVQTQTDNDKQYRNYYQQ